MNNLQFNESKNLKFHHKKRGGLIANYNKKKTIISTLLIADKAAEFSNDDFRNLTLRTLTLEKELNHLPFKNFETNEIIEAKKIKSYTGNFSKYVNPKIYKNYISKGKWQLGNIHYYRNVENDNIRDEFEGFSFLMLNINNEWVFQVCSSSFNYLILCGTSAINSAYHKEKFGSKEIVVKNINEFASDICKQINAKRYIIQEVEYNSKKTYKNPDQYINDDIKVDGRILSPAYFDVLADNSLYPSLFVKPTHFSEEKEVRIVFEMKKDCNKPYKFKSEMLLKHLV